jgi:hypothetical protein
MTYYYVCFFIFIFVAYLIVTDASVARFFDFLFKFLRIEYEKKKWWILYNPKNPIVKYLIWRRSMKMAEELQKDLERDKNQ